MTRTTSRTTRGRIVDINKHSNNMVFIKQGVKKRDQYKYAHLNGDNGTYVTGGVYLGTSLDVKISVYEDDNHAYVFDVYDDVKAKTGKKKVSAKIMTEIKKHIGDKVDIEVDSNGNYSFDASQILGTAEQSKQSKQ